MKKIMKRLIKYISNYNKYFIFSVILSVISVAGTLIVPVLIGKAVDAAAGKGNVDFDRIYLISGSILTISVVVFVTQWAAARLINIFSVKAVRDIRKNAFYHLQKVPVSYIDKNLSGDLIQRIVNDTEIIADGLLQGANQLISGVLTIIGTLGFMIYINLPISIVVVLLTPLSFIVASQITKASRKAFNKQSKLRGDMNAVSEEMIGNQKILRNFGYEDESYEKFEKLNRQMQKDGARAVFYSALSNPCTRFVNNVIYAAIALIGSLICVRYFSFGISLTVGGLTSFLTYAASYTKPFNEISGVLSDFQNAISAAQRVFDLIDAPEEESDENCENLEETDGSLNISNLSFSYLPSQKLITAFNLNVEHNQRIAIVGPTGCGKTTIINLILRFYSPNEGKISVMGKNIEDYKRDSYRSKFGMVLQDSWLFTGTVAENIAYSKPDVSREEIIQAAKNAYADGFIGRLPNGYDTIITQNGENLSQGQRQLLCIARIMLVDPDYLILDEATSNIDLITEIRIQKAFEKLLKGRTSFIIAHRLSTIRSADKIIVMNNGEIVEQGTHDELIKLGGFYKKLYKSQFEAV